MKLISIDWALGSLVVCCESDGCPRTRLFKLKTERRQAALFKYLLAEFVGAETLPSVGHIFLVIS